MAGGTAATTLSVATFERVVPKSLVSRARSLRPFMRKVVLRLAVQSVLVVRPQGAATSLTSAGSAGSRSRSHGGSFRKHSGAPGGSPNLSGKEPRSTQLCPPSKLASQACRVDGLGVSTRKSGTGMPSATVWLLG